MGEEKKGFKFPSAYTILFILIIVVAITTWIVPAGQYEVNEAGEPIPGTYHQVESNPQRIIADGIMAIVYGIQAEDGTISVYNFGELYGAIDLGFFVLVIGGFLAITMATGSIDAGIGTLIGIWFVTRYAEKVRTDPSKSLVYDQKEENEKHFLKKMSAETLPELTGRLCLN
jgi:uncharacterized ion transporter superfamily protein YfcC